MNTRLKTFVAEKHQLETILAQLMDEPELPAQFNNRRQAIDNSIQQLMVELFFK